MSTRTLIEINHDHYPRDDAACLALGRALQEFMRHPIPEALPPGVTLKHSRHHSEPCPVAALEVIAGGDGDAQTIARQTLRRWTA